MDSPVFEKCRCKVGAPVPRGSGVYDYDPKRYSVTDKATQPDVIGFAVAAATEALRDAQLDADYFPVSKERVGIFVSTGIGNIEEIDISSRLLDSGKRLSPFFVPRILNNLPASNISIRFGFQGPCVSNNMACASSAYSILEGFRSILCGETDISLVGGTESCIGRLGYQGFSAMHSLSTHFNDTPTRACRPFDKQRNGFVMGEGAVVLVLESYESARRRNAPILCEIIGGFTNSDAYHITSPCLEGEGAERCMRSLLQQTSIPAPKIGYINAHATGTQIGDRAEMKAISGIFGELEVKPIVSSTKGATGHLLGAAGALEAGICAYSLKQGIFPGTYNLEESDISFGFELSHESTRREAEFALSNSFGFGGVNVSLCFRRFISFVCCN